MSEIRIKSEAQAFWDSDDNLDAAYRWMVENYGLLYEAFILFAGQNKRDFESFIAAVKQGHNRATIVWDRLCQAEDFWMNKSRQRILNSGDTNSIARMYKFLDKQKKREEKKQELERKKQRLHSKGILTTETTWCEILTGKVKGYNNEHCE